MKLFRFLFTNCIFRSSLQLFISALVANFAFKYLVHELRESIETTVASRRVKTAVANGTAPYEKLPEKVSTGIQMNGFEKVFDL